MTLDQYLLNIGLLAFILISNLGARKMSSLRLLLPVLIAAVCGGLFLTDVPTAGNDVQLEAIGISAGIALGVAAGFFMRVEVRDGVTMLRAGWPYALLWLIVIGGRMLFAYGADHWFPAQIADFSMSARITGAPAWAAAFILMALVMVVARVATTALRAWPLRPWRAVSR
ncbi:hypothetical protein [Leifsonia sp. fls2-241-R2A-40a]|uniref:hypothetical protein n=1 Tax=Leifsonia sp. fls2-241-R2A-40a TaxID=3040290 RepID=UPI00254A7B6C|nr:hypothetical protein [Leifsonia sp. fls2-241-R2A-40a]